MTCSSTEYASGKNALWYQKKCGDPLQFLGCHDVSGLTKPRGELRGRRKRKGKGNFVLVGANQGAPDFGSATIRMFRDEWDLVLDSPCPPNLFIYYSNCGADENPLNYTFIDKLNSVYITETTQEFVVNQILADGETEAGGDIVVEAPIQFLTTDVVKQLNNTTYTVAAVAAHIINDVAICDKAARCPGCDDETDGCQTVWFVTDGIAGSASVDAAIYRTTNGGTAWTLVANPFTDSDDNITDVECVDDVAIFLNGDTAEYAYTQDGGATALNLVTTPTEIMTDVFMLGETKIWICAEGGYVYFSSTRGASVDTQDAGVATLQNLNSISFANALEGYSVGAANAFIYTANGVDWQTGTGPAPATILNVIEAVADTDILIVGDENGILYRSLDNGDNWAILRAATADVASGITSISICDCNVWTFTGNNATDSVVYKTIDGGNEWQLVATKTADIVQSLACCDLNTYWGVGTDGLIFKLAGNSFRD